MPRPKVSPQAKRESLSLSLPPKLINNAKDKAFRAGKSLSSQVEILLTKWLK